VRANKGSNEEWEHPDDPDSKITKMKDGRTHLAHKAEHAVDMETGAVLAVTLQDANAGDTTTICETLVTVAEQIETLIEDAETAGWVAPNWLSELVTDKGYHSNETLLDLKEFEIRSYVSEPNRGRRNWIGKEEERAVVYANRRRIRGERGKRLLRRRGLMLERPFAHCYETGGNATRAPARPRKHSQTTADPCRWVQFESRAAADDRQRDAARSAGLCRDLLSRCH
jgi:transposase